MDPEIKRYADARTYKGKSKLYDDIRKEIWIWHNKTRNYYFKSLTVRIDGNQTITEGENLFIIQGKEVQKDSKPQKFRSC